MPWSASADVRGQKVVLRPVDEDDHPLLRRWQNDPDIARWMDYRTPFGGADIAQDQARAAREGHPFVVELDGTPIGKGGLNRFRDAPGRGRVCALYVYVGEKDLWGTGLGRDTVMALCRAAFDAYGADEVELSLIEGNDRARRVYEACGFRDIGLGQTQTTSQPTLRMGLPARRFRQVRAEYGI